MKNTLLKLLCTLALLGAVASASAGSSNPMTLNYSGYFSSNSKLGLGDSFGVDTAFTLTASFDAANPYQYIIDADYGGYGHFEASSFSFLINGTTYAGSTPSALTIVLEDKLFDGGGNYEVGILTDGGGFISGFGAATQDFNFQADNFKDLTATTFSGFAGTGWLNQTLNIYLDGVEGSLKIRNLSTAPGDFTASLTSDTASVPEPSQIVSLLALSGLGGFGALVKLRRRK
ncbi:MAG: PEP-CTERM sorting domain-containing protein [Verrucomicrobiota bacterium]